MLEQQSFGSWLRRKRKALDLTREELAERVGYSSATIRKIEDEERHPSAQVVERLAEVFKIPQTERPLFFKFARGDLKSAPAQSVEDLPWRASPRSIPPNLPAATTSLIGREKEIEDVRDYLRKADIRLVTLMGPPGIGKTRLSIEAARAALPDFPDGVFFVALAPLNNPALIAVTIAQALGYAGTKNRSTVEQLKEGIGHKQLLLVLDNCEHLIENIASIVSDLLSACSHLKILATSRESLRIPGEWLYPVPAFDVPAKGSAVDMETAVNFPALTLFAERARAVRPDFTLNAYNIQTVSAICAHLDGLPLVIELIAARMRLMTPQALLDRLSSHFVLTADGMRAASERQKTLYNAIDWSYNLLPPEEQKLFAYLSVFSGNFTLEAVETMVSQKVTEKPLTNLIALLLDKSLLKLALTLESSPEARYTMFVTIQEYARERLKERGEETEIRNLHLAYFLDLAEKADRELRGRDQLEWLRRLDLNRDNLRGALDWAIETKQTKFALQLARELHWFWFVKGDHTEGRQWLGRVIALPDSAIYPEAYAEALTQIGHHSWVQIGSEESRPYVERALTYAQEHSDKHNLARALAHLGLALITEGDFASGKSTLEESKELFQQVRDKWGHAHVVIALGFAAFKQDDQAAALAFHEEALTEFQQIGERYFEAVAFRYIGIIKLRQGDVAGGMTALQKALILAQEIDSKYEIGVALYWLGEAAKYIGNPSHAVRLYWAAKGVFISIGAWSQKKDETEFENDLAPCRAMLSEAAFEEAMELGRAMTMEQAIAYALEDQG
jgi:predicted ATPase/DNA-binding XRE family transcriptional regulator